MPTRSVFECVPYPFTTIAGATKISHTPDKPGGTEDSSRQREKDTLVLPSASFIGPEIRSLGPNTSLKSDRDIGSSLGSVQPKWFCRASRPLAYVAKTTPISRQPDMPRER